LDRTELTLIRDPRRQRIQAGARALDLKAPEQLRRLLANTPRKSPERPQILRRVAEAYVEIALDLERRPQLYGQLGCVSDQVRLARSNAVRDYEALLAEYPDDARADEVLYYIAFDYELLGGADLAAATYARLLSRFPKSAWATAARVALAEAELLRAAPQHDWKHALGAYRAALRSQSRNCAPSCIQSLAIFRRAELEWLLGRRRESLDTALQLAARCAHCGLTSRLRKNAARLGTRGS
jgi:tetratricopeptide (TPR) repeat protein